MTRSRPSMMQGTDTWSREARLVQEQARRHGLALSEEDLMLQDVRDLQALSGAAHACQTGPRGFRRMVLPAPWASSRPNTPTSREMEERP